jgi:hypothetical protein
MDSSKSNPLISTPTSSRHPTVKRVLSAKTLPGRSQKAVRRVPSKAKRHRAHLASRAWFVRQDASKLHFLQADALRATEPSGASPGARGHAAITGCRLEPAAG